MLASGRVNVPGFEGRGLPVNFGVFFGIKVEHVQTSPKNLKHMIEEHAEMMFFRQDV